MVNKKLVYKFTVYSLQVVSHQSSVVAPNPLKGAITAAGLFSVALCGSLCTLC